MTGFCHALRLIAALCLIHGCVAVRVADASEETPGPQCVPPQLRIAPGEAQIPDKILDFVWTLAKIDDEDSGKYSRDKQRRWEVEFGRLRRLENAKAEIMVRMLGNADPYARACAADVLGASEEKRSIDALVATLHDHDPLVRSCAALALGGIRHRKALPALIQAMQDEEHFVRRQVATALGHIGSADATQALITAIKVKGDGRSCDVYTPIAIVAMWQETHPGPYNEPASWALTQIGPPAVKALAAALKEPAGMNHVYIAWSLGKIALEHKDTAATQSLVAARDHADQDVRELVAETLGKIDPPKEDGAKR